MSSQKQGPYLIHGASVTCRMVTHGRKRRRPVWHLWRSGLAYLPQLTLILQSLLRSGFLVWVLGLCRLRSRHLRSVLYRKPGKYLFLLNSILICQCSQLYSRGPLPEKVDQPIGSSGASVIFSRNFKTHETSCERCTSFKFLEDTFVLLSARRKISSFVFICAPCGVRLSSLSCRLQHDL